LDNTITFDSILKKSFTALDVFQKIAALDVVVCLAFGIATGMLIYLVYKLTFRGVVYSRTFNVSLVLMCTLTSLIILTISSNVVLSLGMVGALSIVRFRTAIKDPIDIMFLFWAVTAGIATGAGAYSVSILGSLILAGLMFILLKTKANGKVYMLTIHYAEEADEQVRKIMNKLKSTLKAKTMSHGEIEINAEVRVSGENTAFLRELSTTKGVSSASLISYNGEYAD